MTERQSITEDMNVQAEWYKQATGMTLETLPKFLHHLSEDYIHDYGTICHALAAGAMATCYAMNHVPTGAITGFQAGAVMWNFIRRWMNWNHPIHITHYDELLYPQYAEHFVATTISPDIWKWVQEQAQKMLDKESGQASEAHAVPWVVEHWKSITAGNVPFGLTVKEEV